MTAHAPILFGTVLAGSGLVLYRYCPQFIAAMAKLETLGPADTPPDREPTVGEIRLIRALTALIIVLGVGTAGVAIVQALQ
ncbi:MAG: hypothetical protein SVG88_07050 [Halobacteriales archaeon]|nr:hypothetical protein [Halobacteriales archaeon]